MRISHAVLSIIPFSVRVTSSALPRRDDSLASRVSAAAASASLVPYTKPSGTITQILAIGDSYTAGIGSNGLPDRFDGSFDCSRYRQGYPLQLVNDPAWGSSRPDLVFGACSGAKMQGLIDNQLTQGNPNPNLEYTAIGKPQIAIMTISGNDVGFSTAINDCVLRIVSWGDCDTTLANIANYINGQTFSNKLIETLQHVVAAGRQAEGVDPPESFQVYVAGYVQFWNDDDPGCNDISFSFWGFSTPKLPTDLRHRMNILVDQLNTQISKVAAQMSGLGVIYVDGFQSAYNTHRFCEPDTPAYLARPIGRKTWFWHLLSDNYESGGEGPETLTTTSEVDMKQLILDYLIPDKAQQATISESNPPWAINPAAFGSEEQFYSALDKATSDNATTRAWLSENTRRIFHPKGSAYAPYAASFMNAIRANRDLTAPQPVPPATPTGSAPAAYETGVCSFHVIENEAPCASESQDLSVSIVIKDAAGTEIGNTNGYTSIDAATPLSLNSMLPNTLVVTGEHQGDYVQFSYGGLSWTNKDSMMNGTDAVAHCNNGGWDPREGAICGRVSQKAQRNMDCFFVC